MPPQTMHVTAPNGKTLTITGDRVPTETELKDIFTRAGVDTAPPPPTPGFDPKRAAQIVRGDTAAPAPQSSPSMMQNAADVVGGLGSSVARTVFGGGDLIRQGLGMERMVDRPAVKAAMTPPNSTAGRAASAVGDVAQFFAPTGAVGKVKAGLEIAKAGGLTLAQTGSPGSAALSAGLTAVVPGAGAVRALGRASTDAAEKFVKAAIKPTVASLRRITGAGGLDAKANALVRFVIDNRLTTAEKARALFQSTEHELQRVLGSRNAPTDAAIRAGRYLQALENSAAKAGLGADDVALLRGEAEKLVAGPMGEPAINAAGNVVRVLRRDVPAKEALESARASSRWKTRKAWGEQKGATTEAAKAVERAQRDAVKTAVPEAKALLQTEGKALQAEDVLARMAQRSGNRDVASLPAHVIAAGELATGRVPVLAFAANWLRNNQMRAGMWADALGKAIEKGNAPLAADILKRLGVGAASASMPGQLATATGGTR